MWRNLEPPKNIATNCVVHAQDIGKSSLITNRRIERPKTVGYVLQMHMTMELKHTRAIFGAHMWVTLCPADMRGTGTTVLDSAAMVSPNKLYVDELKGFAG